MFLDRSLGPPVNFSFAMESRKLGFLDFFILTLLTTSLKVAE